MSTVRRIMICLVILFSSLNYAYAYIRPMPLSHIIHLEPKKWVVIPIKGSTLTYRMLLSQQELCQYETTTGQQQCYTDWKKTRSIDQLLTNEYDYTTKSGLRIRITHDALCALQKSHHDLCQ